MKATNNNKGKKKKRIRVQPVYTTIVTFMFFVVSTIMIFLGQIAGWDTSDSMIIVWYCLMIPCAVLFFVAFVYYIQFANVDETGIVIRRLFYTIAKLEWKDVYSIEIQSLIAMEGRTYYDCLWLVIKTDKKDEVQGLAGINRKNKPPYCIVASKKNIEIIERFFEVDKTYLKIEEMVKENKRRQKAERKKDKK